MRIPGLPRLLRGASRGIRRAPTRLFGRRAGRNALILGGGTGAVWGLSRFGSNRRGGAGRGHTDNPLVPDWLERPAEELGESVGTVAKWLPVGLAVLLGAHVIGKVKK